MSRDPNTRKIWEKYLDISIGILILVAILYCFVYALKTLSGELNRDRHLCEIYSESIEDYDKCLLKRAKTSR